MTTKASIRLFWIIAATGSLIRLVHYVFLYYMQSRAGGFAILTESARFSGVDFLANLIALFGFVGVSVMTTLWKMEGGDSKRDAGPEPPSLSLPQPSQKN